VPSGEVWGAKDLLFHHIGDRAQAIVMPYKDDPRGAPDPAFTEGLANQIHEGSNFYAVQKMLDGPFSIDIIYEAEDVHQHIDGKPSK
jgi:mannosyl-oligosaccharide glucosidase